MGLHTRLHRLVLMIALGLLLCQVGHAGTVGKISGTVVDGDTGMPIGGANVTVLGISTGASADEAGRFSIPNVPAGTYHLQAAMIGYKPRVLTDVQIAPDFTTEVSFSLDQTILGIVETVEIRAERPLIQKDLTGTSRFISRDELANLPVRGYQEIAGLQAGVVAMQVTPIGTEASSTPRLHVRGGRAEEVAFFVDGFSLQDPLTGLSTIAINKNAIDQMVVMKSGFNAEYGKVMSGAVNIVTREGSGRYSGSLELLTDNLGTLFGTETFDHNTYDFHLGGPILPSSNRLTFFVSGERRWLRDRTPRPIDRLGLPKQFASHYERGRLPSNSLSGHTWQGKITWDVTSSVRVRGGSLGSTDRWQEYRHEFLFNADHMPRYEDRNEGVFATMTQAISPHLYYNLGVNWFYTERYRGDGVHFKDLRAYGQAGNPAFDQEVPLFWVGETDSTRGSVWDDYLHRESSYYGLKGDLAFHWSRSNQAKVGGEYRYHTLRRYRHNSPVQVGREGGYADLDRYGYAVDDPHRKVSSGLDGAKHPKDGSVFLQNKYEKDRLVLNGGLRYDYLHANTDVIADDSLPLGEDRHDVDPEDLTTGRARHKISPRVGVAFPVSERTHFHANYGVYFQQPNLEDLYVSYAFLAHKVRTAGYYFAFGNPNLRPETTTAYEMGLTQQVSPRARVDVTAFYKSVADLVQVQSIGAAPNAYTSFRNTDYGTIKGVECSLDMRRTARTAVSLNYTLSFASGTGSVSHSQRNIAWVGLVPPKQTAPLDFDQRHKAVVSVDWRLGAGEGPRIGRWRVAERSGVNILMSVGSGSPYTPAKPFDEVTLAAVAAEPSGPINSQYGPWRYRVDLKCDRGFATAGMEFRAFIWIQNVMDRRNVLTVYRASGDSDTTGWLATPSGGASYASEEAQSLYQLAQGNPTHYDVPRTVCFGLKLDF